MEIRKILTLRGPNIWSRYPVLEAWVDLGDLKDTASDTIPGFNERLMSWLPSMVEHRCSVGERGGFFQRLAKGTYPAHILEHLILELQTLAGTVVGFGKARETDEEGVFKVAVRYRDEQVARACLFAARELLLAAIHDRPYDVAAELAKLRELAENCCLGPSTKAIVAAAEARGIPARRLNSGSLVQLGFGRKQRRIWAAETDCTSAIAESIAQDKQLTKTLLRASGIPVPEGRAADSPADAWEAACEIGLPVVVKPRDGNHGRGVFTGLGDRELIEKAYELALREGSGVLVESFAPGSEHRLLVVGNKLIAATRGEAAYVNGNGRQTIEELIEEQLNSDPRRGNNDSDPLTPIKLVEPDIVLQLERQGLTGQSIPEQGARVLIQRNGNLGIDCTDEVHPSIAVQAVLAAQTVGLDVAGLDLVVEDVSRPLHEQGGAFVEVNAGPGLVMHLQPSVGKPRPVGEAIVATLFPEGENGRIPIVAVTGTNGKTTVTRLIAHLWQGTGKIVGMTTTDGICVDGRQIEVGDCSGPRSARQVLLNPNVEAAVFEAARGGLLREGLGVDRCDVAVVTNIGEADHLGAAYINTPEQMFTVKRTPVDVVPPGGASVLKADDPLVFDMAELCAGAVTLFAQDENHPKLAAHRALGKRTAFLRQGDIVLAEGTQEFLKLPAADVPVTHGGRVPFQIENVMAAAAAAWALGVPSMIAERLQTFGRNPQDDPGRFTVMAAHGVTCILDDCHNTSALAEVIKALDRFPEERRTIVYSAGDGRRDADIIRQGRQLGEAFDRVIVYEDYSASDRAPGELTGLFREGLSQGKRVSEVLEIREQQQAVAAAFSLVRPGELLLVQPEEGDIGPSLDLIQKFALRQVPEPNGCLMDSDERDESAASWQR